MSNIRIARKMGNKDYYDELGETEGITMPPERDRFYIGAYDDSVTN